MRLSDFKQRKLWLAMDGDGGVGGGLLAVL
jgi:hypothetical protein